MERDTSIIAAPKPSARERALALHPPPGEIGWLVECVGAANALALIETYGGTKLKMPVRSVREGSPLVRLIGMEAARKLAAWRERTLTRGGNGSVMIYIPLLKWWRLKVHHAEGMRQPEIARKLGISVPSVQRHLMLDRQKKAASRQRGAPRNAAA